MKLYVLASCSVDESGNGETRTPAVFTSLKQAQNALQEEFDNLDLEELDETMDTQCTDFSDPDCVDADGGYGYANVYYKNGCMSQYEIYEVEVE